MNGMAFTQLSTILAGIVSQATGTAVQAAVDTKEFVSVAQVGLKTGYDPLATAITQTLSKTIFSVRPYQAKFKGLQADSVRYGNHVRKLTTLDKPFEDDQRYSLSDGYSKDQYVVNKPSVIQTNFYGEVVFEKSLTIYKDQLDCAMTGPEEFGRFIAMIMQNASDMIEQAKEEIARGTIANLIGGIALQEANSITSGRRINLLQQYETETGVSLTSATVMQPSYFPAFARWLFGFLKTLSDRMTNRTNQFHQNFTINDSAVNIMRHTPIDKQKCYLYSPVLNNISANVLSTVFYDKYLKLMDHEDVDFWQTFKTPDQIKIKPSYTAADGTITDASSAVTVPDIFGVIFDEEAAGYTQINEWSANTPFNAAGGYALAA